MVKKEFKINGMTCHHCVKAVEVELEELGVYSHEVEIGSAVVEWDDNKISEEQIINAITEAGYQVAN